MRLPKSGAKIIEFTVVGMIHKNSIEEGGDNFDEKPLNIWLIEPFFTGSHQSWALGYQQHSQHQITILSLPGRYWKWRMYGGAVSLAKLAQSKKQQPDLLLATDMLDLTTFLALTRSFLPQIPTALYFHENQITYPWSPSDPDITLKRDNQYGFINYTSTLAADKAFFNSDYHLQSFLGALPSFLKQFPDHQEIANIPLIEQKCQVLPLGIDLQSFDAYETAPNTGIPLLLWNHRWEYDKNPTTFFNTLFRLKSEEIPFQVALLGKSYSKMPPIFKKAKSILEKEIVQFGPVASFEEYATWLWKADILPVTNQQDFFGQSVVEAIYCNCHPILPNRLAYPMHLPTSQHKAYFYQSEEVFYQMLKTALLNIAQIRNQSTQEFVSQYDWRILAKEYDRQLALVLG